MMAELAATRAREKVRTPDTGDNQPKTGIPSGCPLCHRSISTLILFNKAKKTLAASDQFFVVSFVTDKIIILNNKDRGTEIDIGTDRLSFNFFRPSSPK